MQPMVNIGDDILCSGCALQEYYAAQCTNTKLNYEKKQLERKRDQLLSRWRMHATVVCRRSSTLASPAEESDFLQLLSPGVPGSTSTEELQLQQGGAPDEGGGADDDDDVTDESGDEDEEQMNLFDELLDFYDYDSSQSPSCPVETDASTEYPPLVGFDDQDVQPLSIFKESTPTDLRTPSAAASTEETAMAREMESEHLALLPDPCSQRPESSLTTRTGARSRSFPSAYSEPAQCSSRTETRTRSDTVDTDSTTTQPLVSHIPLVVVRTEPYDSDYEDD